MAYYVIGAGNNLYEGMTKEQILAAITQAIETHTISDVDTGFVTTIKEKNKNNPLSVWVGTEAEYNAIQNKQPNCLYIKTDDSTLEAIAEQIAEIESINEYLSRQNKVLWTGAVNDSSTAEEKVLTAPGVETYNLLAFVVSRFTDRDVEDITILAYKNNGIKFLGYNNDKLYVQATAGAVLTTSSGNIVKDKIKFSYAQFKIGTGDTQNVYLKKIIGVM